MTGHASNAFDLKNPLGGDAIAVPLVNSHSGHAQNARQLGGTADFLQRPVEWSFLHVDLCKL